MIASGFRVAALGVAFTTTLSLLAAPPAIAAYRSDTAKPNLTAALGGFGLRWKSSGSQRPARHRRRRGGPAVE